MKFALKKIEPKPWHPDFRRLDTLPDIKLVRTDFLVNAVSVLLLVFTGAYFFVSNSVISSVKSSIKDLDLYISNAEPKNAGILASSREFKQNSQLLLALKQYFTPYSDPLQYLLVFSDHKDDSILFDEINFIEKSESYGRNEAKSALDRYLLLSIKGSISGSYNQALDAMNQYMDTLSELQPIASTLKDIEMVSLKRDPKVDMFTYQIDITLKPSSQVCTLEQS